MEIRLHSILLASLVISFLLKCEVNCVENIKTLSKNNRIDISDHIDKGGGDIVHKNSKRNCDDEVKVEDETDTNANAPHSRQKRLLWITNDGRLALPPGTAMVITPTLSLPFVRHPPDGFFSNMSISLPLTIDFDKLGLTDNENPYGDLPPIFARSFGHSIGQMAADFVGKILNKRKFKRGIEEMPKEVQQRALDVLHGGERALLFGAVEDLLSNFGVEGKPCLLRAICEVHAHPMTNFGLLGEMMKLFLTASKSPYSHLLEEYVQAEKAGIGADGSPGECWPYYKDCPKSLFKPKKNKYLKDAEKDHLNDDLSKNNGDADFYGDSEKNNINYMHE